MRAQRRVYYAASEVPGCLVKTLLTHPLLIVAALTITLAGCVSVPPDVGTLSPDNPDAGELTVQNNSYRVLPDDLVFTGQGRYAWPNGRVFEGDFVGGQPHGRGIETTLEGVRYEGEWSEGQHSGLGVLTRPDGSRYRGEFRADLRDGDGVYESPTGRYSGQWHADVPHGEGVFYYDDDSTYTGAWEVGRRSGWGIYARVEGSQYQGDWVNDVPHGFGELVELDGYSYDGGWNRGDRDGYGKRVTRPEIVYEGTWVANQRHGYGFEIRVDGSQYTGEWRDNQRHGEGVAEQLTGTRHEGYWEHNTTLGPGTRRTADGIEITGLWNGNYVTSGIVRLPSGLDYAGNLYDASNKSVDGRFLDWLIQVGEAGDPHAQLLLGEAYLRFTKPARDSAKATAWYARAAGQGLAEAQYQLAELYLESGQPPGRAIDLLMRAAEQGHPAANLALGTLYQLGDQVARNHLIAKTYYEAATDRGNITARNNLAWLLATSPEPNLRDGERAVALAEPVAMTFDTWGYLDTLAAAWAEQGDFGAAVRTQQRAIKLAGSEIDPATLQALQERLKLFEAKHPYREP